MKKKRFFPRKANFASPKPAIEQMRTLIAIVATATRRLLSKALPKCRFLKMCTKLSKVTVVGKNVCRVNGFA
jgi:hypothetical protein